MIRRATPDDAPAIGRIHARARDEMTYLPRIPDADRPRLGGWFLDRNEIWIVEEEGAAAGYLALHDDELAHLYVEPDAQDHGLGTALLDHAKRLRPERLELWVFQRNDGARRFYERHGFRLVRLTDGAANREREPDALYEWLPLSPGRAGAL